MKIIYNTDQIYLHGGIEKVMATKANYFANTLNYEVYIVTTEQKNNASCYNLDEKIHLIDLGVDYNRAKSYFSFENITKALKHFVRQKKIFKKLKPDVVISPNFNFDFYWLPFIQKKAKKIKEIHASRYNWNPTLKNRINRWFEKKYHAIVVLNKDEAAYFSEKNISVIPNPIDESNLRANLDNNKVIAAGRISPVKGFDQLISAWKKVHREFPQWQLHIYGQDYLNTKAKLDDLIRQNGLKEVVFLKESEPDLLRVMTDYSIYAMSSITECFPMVLLEAMSVGLPVVSYDCPNGPRNIIQHRKDGLLVSNQDANALSDGLLELIRNESLRKELGANAYKNIKKFSLENVMNKWECLFQDLMSYKN